MTMTELPKYEQVKRKLIDGIESGLWPVGSSFPSEAQLLNLYKVSRPTLVRSLQEMTSEGYLNRQQGRGTIVASRVPHRHITILPIFVSSATADFTGGAREVLLSILRGIQAALKTDQHRMVVRHVPARELDDDTRMFIDQITPGAALVVESSFNPALVAYLRKRNFVIWSVNEPTLQGHCVYIDQQRAGYLATKHLLDQGRRRIALLNGLTADFWGFKARLDGYRQAMQEAGIDLDPALMCEGDHPMDSEAGRAMLRSLLTRAIEVDGVVGVSDAKAMGAMALAIEMGRRVPQDIAFVAIDDTIASQASPALSAVYMPFTEVGRQAAMQAISDPPKGSNQQPVETHICIQPALVAR